MRLAKRKLFKQLEDRHLAMPVITDPIKSIFPEQPSIFPKNSLGFFADQMRIPVAILIEQFSDAGIYGLTPKYQITDADKSSLLSYLRAQHSAKSRRIYIDNEPIEQQLLVVQDITIELLTALAKNLALYTA